MPYITVGRENSAGIDIYYEDHGAGSPVVLIHGYPLNGHSWEKQELALLQAGYRVITYDRRGFGGSSRPSVGYDYDTFAADLNTLLTVLDLREIALVGFSMGTGEVMRYLGTYGSSRVRKAVLFGPLGPFLLKTPDNPEGVDREAFDGLIAACTGDRPAFMKGFLDNFYNFDVYGGTLVSEQAWQGSFNVATAASAKAALDCISAWLTDFRQDLSKIDVPTLVVQGSDDRILPPAASGNRLPGLISDLKHIVIDGGPHAIGWTHPATCNEALLDFLLGRADRLRTRGRSQSRRRADQLAGRRAALRLAPHRQHAPPARLRQAGRQLPYRARPPGLQARGGRDLMRPLAKSVVGYRTIV